ncbi:hypothetical protein B0H10DRAFT_2121960 [Mycena sp. CBHHK59/15]|nr:hypothetical protein B0H10DRAFT_2121960 [Mycena sp. CBHHK59/15]
MPPLQDEQPLWGSRRRAGPGRNLEDVPAPPLFVPLLRHVKSLTSELTSHQELLVELYGSHLRHVSALAETGAEIVQLRQEVTGLDGEVEALRALVKEWTNQPPVRVVMSQDLETPSQQEEPAQSFEALSIAGSVADTDNAMLGSPVPTMAPDDFFTIGNEELARIAADVQQRRERLLGACPSTQSSHTDHTSRRSRASFAVPELLRSALSAMQSLSAEAKFSLYYNTQ